MPTHIVVNGLGLTYKTTSGISTATMPDVCKTPSPGGPVPIPYPNIAKQSSLTDGTTTVFAKGKMIAVKGSHYSSSNGDEAGTAGGVKSNVNMKATDWITYSFDVKMDGKNACRHTDKKFHNNQNTVDAQGNIDPAPPVEPFEIDCQDAPKKPGSKKFTRCDREEICGKIRAMEERRQEGMLVRTQNYSEQIYRVEREAGNAICRRINAHAHDGRGPDGHGNPEDLGFHKMSEDCLEYKKATAQESNYHGFSPDHVYEIQLGGHPTDLSNLVWMESKTNEWIGTTFRNYDPEVHGEISGNCCE
jgi:hypothetical protein